MTVVRTLGVSYVCNEVTVPSMPALRCSDSCGKRLSFFNCHSSTRPAKSRPSTEGNNVDWIEDIGIVVLEIGEVITERLAFMSLS